VKDDPFFDPETMYRAPTAPAVAPAVAKVPPPALAGADFMARVSDLHRLAAMDAGAVRAELQRRIAAGVAVEDALETAYLAGRLAVALVVWQRAVLEGMPSASQRVS
jgi:hypothetical protein